MSNQNANYWKEEIRKLLDHIEDEKVLRRVWKILIRAL